MKNFYERWYGLGTSNSNENLVLLIVFGCDRK